MAYVNHKPLHGSAKGPYYDKISPDNIANLKAKWNLVDPIYSVIAIWQFPERVGEGS